MRLPYPELEIVLEPPSAATSARFLVPCKTTAGYWVFVPRSHAPSGSTIGAFTDAGSYNILDVSTTTGLRARKGPGGMVFVYA